VRTLCLLNQPPGAIGPGGQATRTTGLLEVWRSLGSIDIVIGAFVPADERRTIAASFPGARLLTLTAPMPDRTTAPLRWAVQRRVPRALAAISPTAARLAFRDFVLANPDPYTAAWCAGSVPMWQFGSLVRGVPKAIDFGDVQAAVHDRLLDEARRAPDRMTGRGVQRRAHLAVERARWSWFDRDEASRADLVTVRSAADREVLGVPGAVAVADADLGDRYERLVREVIGAAQRSPLQVLG
jgi:hypothetical protein